MLVTGPWGCGKTHQVKHALDEAEYFYVSLFGLQNSEEIKAAVYAEMFPGKSRMKKIAGAADGISVPVPSVATVSTKGLPSAIVGAILGNQVNTSRILIFDDLERCRMPLNDVLGVINRYVEHHKCRVVVIAHDDMVEGLTPIKEKVFGQTIRVSSQIDGAFESFVQRFTDAEDRAFLQLHRAAIIDVFKASGSLSLRNLKHSLEDLSRIRRALRSGHLENEAAMRELVGLFVALSSEVRQGNLTQKEIGNRAGARIGDAVAEVNRRGGAEPEKSAFKKAQERHPSIDLSDSLLKDPLLVEMLFNGGFDSEAIRASLDQDSHFLKLGAVPAWRAFIDFESVGEGEAEAAQQRLLKEFDGRQEGEHALMLHAFALRFMMAEHGLINADRRSVLDQCKAYVDDLEKGGRLAPLGQNWTQQRDARREAADGIGYWVEDAYRAEFEEIGVYINAARQRILFNTLPAEGEKLLALLGGPNTAFFEQVCVQNRAGEYNFSVLPVLATIDPAVFVDAWMKAPAENWYWISGGLFNRYKNTLHAMLSDETEWIRRVLELLAAREEEASSPILKLRIARIKARSEIPPLLDDKDAMDREHEEAEMAARRKPSRSRPLAPVLGEHEKPVPSARGGVHKPAL
ncbi:KAP family NTPase [Rhizobium leguminosarum]|nr:KAP family NTPase [Rhizobium leguminosarum]